ncbi:MAG: hypothetical protein KKC76_18800 [Proteobacteria bacterium]|nr:hypothetical protein [Pseudomonadota bacterium]MBU4295258.1 hypothetical protein [Pseudomonadota bacterium]MCG2750194.1 hypothetical protein [Desulfobulbaceae bacterium]
MVVAESLGDEQQHEDESEGIGSPARSPDGQRGVSVNGVEVEIGGGQNNRADNEAMMEGNSQFKIFPRYFVLSSDDSVYIFMPDKVKK